MKIKYKEVYFGGKFTFEELEYIKTNYNRGYYWKNGRKIFRTFKIAKLITVKRDSYYDGI